MTPEEKLEQDALHLVALWARVFTKLKVQCVNISDETLLNVATELTTAKIRRDGVCPE